MVLNQKRARLTLWILAIIAVAVFIVQFVSGELSAPLLTFFEALKFLLAATIGFLFQILLSSDEFRQEFQRFAISAYRRISDIRSSVHHIREDISRQRSQYSHGEAHGFDVIAVRAEEIERQVASSEDDWKDFLKREILALEEIERRRDRIREIAASASAENAQSTDARIQELREEIRHFAASLPISLKTLVDIERGEELPREGRHSATVAAFIENSIRESGFLRIPVDARTELNGQRVEQISANAPYSYYIEPALGVEYFLIVGLDGSEIGWVDNPFQGVYDKDYYLTLLEYVPAPAREVQPSGGGPTPIAIPHSEFDRVADAWYQHFYIKVPVGLAEKAA
jgi:hypothetical protein